MSHTGISPRRIALGTLALVASFSLEGCQRAEQGTYKDRRRAQMQSAVAAAAQNVLKSGTAGATAHGDSVEFRTANGWIVKGSDFLTFWPCGRSGYFYMKAPPAISARIAQEYKFANPVPYSAMFAELSLAFVDDSIRVGERRFDRYAEVAKFKSIERADATCAPPRRTVLSTEMQRLDRFKVDILTR